MKNKKFKNAIIAGAFLASPLVFTTHGYAATTSFTDIDGSYAKDAINELVNAGIISGKGNGIYDPSGTLTREQFARILASSLGLDVSNPSKISKFSDVSTSDWAYPFIDALAKKNIFMGYPDGKFRGGRSLSRAHMAQLFVKSLDVDVSGYGKKLKFTDKIPVDYQDAIGFAVENGLMKGKPNGTFDPTGNATREQAAVVTATFIKVKDVIQKPNPTPEPEPKPEPEPTPDSGSSSGSGSGLSSQQIAINKIDKIVKDADASKITLNDINVAIKGKSVKTVEGNIDVYRDVISSAEDAGLNSAEKIANMVADVNTTLDKQVTEGITVTGGTDFRYRLLTDPSMFNVSGVSKVVSWATPMNDSFTSSDIYGILKSVPSIDSGYFFSIPTTTPLKLKPNVVGVYQVLFVYVGEDKQVLGYSLHNDISVTNNHLPVVNELWTAPEFTISQEEILDLTELFSDVDGDELTYSVEALDDAIATVTEGEENEKPTIHPIATGMARFKITVNDGNGGSTETTVSVTINPANSTGGETGSGGDTGTGEDTDSGNSEPENHVPEKIGAIGNRNVLIGAGNLIVPTTGIFTDQDDDSLSLSALSDDDSIATVVVRGTDLVITPVGVGAATITLTVSDGKGGTAQDSFIVSVAAPIVASMTMAYSDKPEELISTLKDGAQPWKHFILTLKDDTLAPGFNPTADIEFGGDLSGLTMNGYLGMGSEQVLLDGVHGTLSHTTGQGTITIKGRALQSGKDLILTINVIPAED